MRKLFPETELVNRKPPQLLRPMGTPAGNSKINGGSPSEFRFQGLAKYMRTMSRVVLIFLKRSKNRDPPRDLVVHLSEGNTNKEFHITERENRWIEGKGK